MTQRAGGFLHTRCTKEKVPEEAKSHADVEIFEVRAKNIPS